VMQCDLKFEVDHVEIWMPGGYSKSNSNAFPVSGSLRARAPSTTLVVQEALPAGPFALPGTTTTSSAVTPEAVQTAPEVTKARRRSKPSSYQNASGAVGCEVKEEWLHRARMWKKHHPDLESVLPQSTPFPCVEYTNVCYHNDEIIVLVDQLSDGTSTPQSKTNVQIEEKEFRNQPAHIIPGYSDGLNWMDSRRNMMGIRYVANTPSAETQDVYHAPLLDITPITVTTHWGFNFGESMWNSWIFAWLHFAWRHPEVGSMPLLFNVAHGLNLPGFWRIQEPLVSAVESFHAVSRECPSGPVCFKKAYHCHGISRKQGTDPMHPVMQAIEAGGREDWTQIVGIMLKHWCPGHPDRQLHANSSGPLVIGFMLRQPNRRIYNLNDLLELCKNTTVGNRTLECSTIGFSNPTKDVCAVQPLDVLIGTHGAGLTNAAFMRPGTSFIELKAERWWQSEVPWRNWWGNAIWRQGWYINTSYFWEYRAREKDGIRSLPKDKKQSARDLDIRVKWEQLVCMLEKIVALGGNRTLYEQWGNEKKAPRLPECDGIKVV